MDINNRDEAAQRMVEFCRKEGLPESAVGALVVFFVRFGMQMQLSPEEATKLYAIVAVWAKENSPAGVVNVDIGALIERARAALEAPNGSMN